MHRDARHAAAACPWITRSPPKRSRPAPARAGHVRQHLGARLTTMARRTALSSPRSRSRRRWTTPSAAAKTSSPPCGASLCRLPSLGEASPHRRTRRGRRVGTTKTKGSRGSRVAASLSRPVGGQCIWFSRSAQLGGLRVAAFWGVCFGELASISVYGMHAFCCAFCCVSCFVC